MPKLTKTGWELGSSETAPVVLGVDDYGNTNQSVLEEHKRARAGVETLDTKRFSKQALMRGTHLEHGVAAWFLESIKEDIPNLKLWEPKEAFYDKEHGLGSSVDRILEIPVGHELVIGSDGEEPTIFIGKGIVEIKTDFYHKDVCKPMWMIQVHQQMITTGLPWALVVCMNQKGQLKLYPFHRDDLLVQTIKDKAKEFWQLVEDDGDYPPLPAEAEAEGLKVVELSKDDRKNFDLDSLCSAYQAASSEARQATKIKDGLKDQIIMHMDSIDADVIKTETFTVKCVTTKKPKKQMVPVQGEFVETTSFNIKEVSHDE
jgi:hypothetical protein